MSKNKEKTQNYLYEERVSQARVVRKIVFFCVIELFLIGTSALISSYYYITNALGPIDEEAPKTIQVTVPIGATSNQIGSILEDEGLVRNGTLFRYYVRYKNESGFQAGQYTLSTNMTMAHIVDEFKEGKVIEEPELVFTVPEGRWLEDVAKMIAKEINKPEEQ